MCGSCLARQAASRKAVEFRIVTPAASSDYEAGMTKRALIGLADWQQGKSSLRRIARALDSGRRVAEADYELGFAQAGDLLVQITKERLRLLAVLRTNGPSTIYALAKRLGRNYSNVHSDVKVLLELGLIERNEERRIFVPWKEFHIRLPLANAA
jgi:predicted transcriptional regulator